MHEFSPPAWLRGGHRMTFYAWAVSDHRHFPALAPAVPRLFDVEPGTRVLAQCHWQDLPASHPTVVTLHGLEGSADAHYMLGIAEKSWHLGFNVIRLNQRNCGGTEHLSQGLYHSGLTADVLAVVNELAAVDRLPSIVVTGYSLGGNLALRLAGLLGDGAPRWLRAVCAVSPTLDLSGCMTAMERPVNRVSEWYFMKSLRRRIRRKAELYPERYDVRGLWKVWRIRGFDDRYTAPQHGFKDAADYYYQMASMRVVDRIRVPTLIITAEDDPFIPAAPFRDPTVTSNPNITLRVTRYGGHCGFIENRFDGYDGYWAEASIVEFISRAAALRDNDPGSLDAGPGSTAA